MNAFTTSKTGSAMIQLRTDRHPAILRRAARLGLILLLAPAATLVAGSPRFTLRAHGVWLSPAGDQVTVTRSPAGGGEERTTHQVSADGTGFGLSLAYRVARRISVELGVWAVDVDNDFRLDAAGTTLTDVETMGVKSVYLGVDWHLTPAHRADVRLGLFLAQTEFDDVIFLTAAGRSEKLTFDDDHGAGVRLAVDWPFRPAGRWLLSADLRYLVTLLESEIAGQDLDFDPLVVTAGVGFRF